MGVKLGSEKRRPGEVPRGKEWVRPYRRAQRKLNSAARLILATIHAVAQAGRCASRPVQSTRMLIAALRQVTLASQKLAVAERNLIEAKEAFAHTPPELQDGDASELLELANQRCRAVQHSIYVAANEVLLGHTEIFNGVQSGELVPEDPQELSGDRPRRRIVIIPRHRPLFVRAFLAARRQPRAADRITPVLRRRRRTPRPAEVRVPRRNLRDRAPPLSSICSL